MKLVDAKTLRSMVLYSRQHVARLEKDGLFPKRIQLGKCRVGWSLDEVEAWLKARMDRR